MLSGPRNGIGALEVEGKRRAPEGVMSLAAVVTILPGW
jgi:hypothetical protein